ncbi:MAG: DDE-type integrase/transposase/recombinase [Pseudonocardiales bacterium]|nr:DDE-type integrase/transposase/recombinase [Pseudonocardiales bacterium]
MYLYRAIDQYSQVIDVLLSEKRDLAATRRFFTRALEHGPRPTEMTTDQARAYPRVIEERIPAACRSTLISMTSADGRNPAAPPIVDLTAHWAQSCRLATRFDPSITRQPTSEIKTVIRPPSMTVLN